MTEQEPQGVRLQLPVLWCTVCSPASQLVHHIFLRTGTEQLLCLWCAKHAAAHGEQVSPLSPDAEGWVEGAQPPIPADEAVQLLLELGARRVA